ncbi:hypothetical protein BpHYR1_016136 [Brachionus plicatilis]|uniref:Uncharacterized protein n=1 Tax=Brachionus plicatilis TaxID=10195 RepID=A0A3M7QQS1_BRAPC|nr:hypothetical protein BpHYR1_016136 [Brachionus plicatilis]
MDSCWFGENFDRITKLINFSSKICDPKLETKIINDKLKKIITWQIVKILKRNFNLCIPFWSAV